MVKASIRTGEGESVAYDPDTSPTICFAAVGDVHGHMRTMVRLIQERETAAAKQISFVLQTGDFEPHRSDADLATMAAPSKYKVPGDFPDFYRGRDRLPWPLYFIGGNHEPYGFLEQMPRGGRVVENCHYLGRVGVLVIQGLRVVGLSGLYRKDLFRASRPSPAEFGKRSNKDFISFTEGEIHHAIEFGRADILMLHEWPSGIVAEEDRAEIERQRLTMQYEAAGNDYARILVELLAPRLVLCGHMHKKYRRTVTLESGASSVICCLPSVEQGSESVALFAADSQMTITEIA